MSAEPAPPPTALPAVLELPEPVRARVVALTARVLPDVARLPAPLRKVAAFTPTRRARHGGGAVLHALGADEEFREHVGVLVAALPDDGSGPADRAARLWLVRPEGVDDSWPQALAELSAAQPVAADADARVDALTTRVAALQQVERDQRTRHRAQLQRLKDENAELRRKVGETRAAERAARERADRVATESSAAVESATAATAAADAEARRLRAQVEELRAVVQRGRSEGRAEREDASLRARLLLDTVLDAAAGLQRELALPTTESRPADRLTTGTVGEGVRSPMAGLSPASPALLEQYLALPRVHLIVDGYNVSKTAWPSSALEAQRTRLLTALAALAARTRAEVTVVFDAHAGGSRPVVATPRGVRVVFSPAGVIADDVIRDYVAVEPPGRVVVVVTTDQELARDVVGAGVRAVAAEALIAMIQR